ncbi:hypothetical protein QTV42_004225 [Vibrio vulnificus]|nr:hypothetical protein [Vibrio vulnificus]EKG2484577.1 hypothetical protein [Vibrio vulnificus]ELP6772750.1 hypothetical protein [Vibrio vulnificus]
MKELDKSDIADEFLDQAIECFLDSCRYASSLHLAGAAQEIYEKVIKSERAQDFTSILMDQYEKVMQQQGIPFDRKEFLKESRIPKNSIKHMDGKKDRLVTIDIEKEALEMLSKAVTDALLLQKPVTPNIKRFQDYFVANALSYI